MVRLIGFNNRAALDVAGRAIDVEKRSNGKFSADAMQLFACWDAFVDWAAEQKPHGDEPAITSGQATPCVPRPRNIYGVGVNYKDHIEEAGMEQPKAPMIFAKFTSCLAGPGARVALTSNRVDWEAELVVVMGRGGANIAEDRAFDAIAGFAAGQDLSDRRQQFADKPPQFSLGKSARGFGPIGPAVVPLREFANPNDLAITCDIAGQRMQSSRTSNMVFNVAQLVAFISRWCELAPGDLIFTGTPGGTGGTRDPRVYLKSGDVIRTEIEQIGAFEVTCA